jgi:hypothetical protein
MTTHADHTSCRAIAVPRGALLRIARLRGARAGPRLDEAGAALDERQKEIVMKKLMLCGALSLIGMFACAEPLPEAPDPAPETAVEPAPGDEAAGSLVGSCCIDYTCPSPDFETTGCKTGSGPSIREAYEACNAVCPVPCASSGLYCDEEP